MREAYIVDKNSIRNINRIYVGVAGKARKVIKGYVGVNGKARLMFERDKERLKEPSITLPYNGGKLAGDSNDNYEGRKRVHDIAVFAGGYSQSETKASAYAYNKNLSVSQLDNLSQARCNLCATAGYSAVVFAGGGTTISDSSAVKNVDCYYPSLTHITFPDLSTARTYSSATNANSYVVIAGGYDVNGGYTTAVDAYYIGGTKVNISALTYARASIGAANIVSDPPPDVPLTPHYMVFGGGDRQYVQDDIDIYDEYLTKQSSMMFPEMMHETSASEIEDVAIFGGFYGNIYSINKNLTITAGTGLITQRTGDRTAVTMNDVVLFCDRGKNVEVYDKSLTKSTLPSMDEAKYSLASAQVGDYALIAGNKNYDDSTSSIDVYAYDYA